MGAYTKVRDSVDRKIKQVTDNPEKFFEKIKLADVVVVVGGLMILGFVLNIISSIMRFIFLWAAPAKATLGL